MKKEFWYSETSIRWWHCWRWMFAPMAVLRVDHTGNGYLVPVATAKAICTAHNNATAPDGPGAMG